MKSPICALLGIEFPLIAFSHCRDVIAPVSRAGGMGVFGAGALSRARLEEELAWIDTHIDGQPYGVDLLIHEAETSPVVKEKMLAATSRDTVRSRSRTGKPSRQLRSAWTDAWEMAGSPQPLPMPLQSLLSEPALARVEKLAQSGHEGARKVATYWVGQGVGLMNEAKSVRAVMQAFQEDFLAACERMGGLLAD